MFVRAGAKSLFLVCYLFVATVTDALADHKRDIQEKFESWVSGEARYFVSLEGRQTQLDLESPWRKENDNIVNILIENGYLESYRKVDELCSDTSASLPNCESNNEVIFFRPTAKMTKLFPAKYLFEIIKGKYTGVYFVIGKVKYFNVLDISASSEGECDYFALVQKGINKKTEIGKIIADFDEYNERYCFESSGDELKLVKYWPEY